MRKALLITAVVSLAISNGAQDMRPQVKQALSPVVQLSLIHI